MTSLEFVELEVPLEDELLELEPAELDPLELELDPADDELELELAEDEFVVDPAEDEPDPLEDEPDPLEDELEPVVVLQGFCPGYAIITGTLVGIIGTWHLPFWKT